MGTIFDRASECATKGRSNLIDLKLVLSVVEGTDVKKRNFGGSLDFVKNVSNFQEKVPDTNGTVGFFLSMAHKISPRTAIYSF